MNLLMVNNLLMLAGGSIDGDAHMDGSQYWGVTLAGLGIVIAALALLVIVIFLFGKLFDFIHSDKKKVQSAAAAAKAPKSAPPKPAPPAPKSAAPAVAVPAEDEDEVIAVISAVVAMMSEADGTVYKVRSVKPVGNGYAGRTAWAMDGRRQNVAPF